ncbi:MAG: hypothetical protein AAGI54_02525 [Planctomycetota bacterium]
MPLGRLAKMLPGRVHPSTLHRWRGEGFEAIRVGREVYSTEAHLRHFLLKRDARRAPADLDDPTVEPDDLDLDAIEAECEAAGL